MFPGFDSPAYGQIGGNLPWQGGPNPAAAAASSNPQAIAQQYGQAYNSALAMNQANYQNILSGYQKAMASQTSAQQAIAAGYTSLYNDVIGKVSGIGQARANAIERDSARQLAGDSQQLIDRGLGNTTVQSSVNRGVEADRNLQLTQLSDDQAKMVGDYMSQLGLAGLGNSREQLNNSTGLATRQLDWMNSVNARYPDANLYAGLARDAAAAHSQQTPFAFGGGSFAGGGGGGGPQLGYVPSQPYFGGSGGPPGAGFGGGGVGGMPAAAAPWNTPDAGYAGASGYGSPETQGNPMLGAAIGLGLSTPSYLGGGSRAAAGNADELAYGGGGDF
jgi:hypothetical protein